MSSKEEYEAGKAARKAERDALIAKAQKNDADEAQLISGMFDIADRIATAFERIADGLNAKGK